MHVLANNTIFNNADIEQMVILRIIFMMSVMLLLGGAGLYAARPDLLDQLSMSNLSKEERARIARIKRLTITSEQKDILMNGNIFMGAGAHMVELAIGSPRFVTTQPVDNDTQMEVWGYHFERDGRPTLLEFNDNQLVNAYKSSYIDIEKQYGSLVMRDAQ